MKIISFSVIVVVGMVSLTRCAHTEPPFPIEGIWQGVSLIVKDSIWQVHTDPVRLTLSGEETYVLDWYNGHQEAGKWHCDFPELHIRPQGRKSRYLSILYLDSDSLLLKGTLDQGATQIGFRRFNQESPQ